MFITVKDTHGRETALNAVDITRVQEHKNGYGSFMYTSIHRRVSNAKEINTNESVFMVMHKIKEALKGVSVVHIN